MLDNVKICFRCGRTRRIEMFYKHPQMVDGRIGKCKECAKKDVRENYALKRKQYSDYDKRRFQTPHRKAQMLITQRRRRREHPKEARASGAVRYALSAGKITKEPCFYCGNTKVQAHHNDYSKPLEVKWVCFKCHREKEHGQVISDIEWGAIQDEAKTAYTEGEISDRLFGSFPAEEIIDKGN